MPSMAEWNVCWAWVFLSSWGEDEDLWEWFHDNSISNTENNLNFNVLIEASEIEVVKEKSGIHSLYLDILTESITEHLFYTRFRTKSQQTHVLPLLPETESAFLNPVWTETQLLCTHLPRADGLSLFSVNLKTFQIPTVYCLHSSLVSRK